MNSNSTLLFEADALDIWRGPRRLCHNISFQLHAGEILHLQGPNGSGKTSLLRTLTGLSFPEAGAVRWRGQSIHRQRHDFQQELAWLAHQNGLKDGLTPHENLYFAATLRPAHGRADAARVLADLGLDDCRDLPCRHLSAGQRRRVALARVLLASARLWLLDEPYTSLDSATIRQVNAAFAAHLAAGGLIVLSSHQPLELGGRSIQVLNLGEAG